VEAQKEDRQEVIAACLARILKSNVFQSSERLSSFLSYVVNESLAGRSDKLKGYTIALSVFGCNDSFDPQTNSIVRVEATRLRKRLQEYYDGPGATDPIEIRINRGTYVPEFIDRRAGAASPTNIVVEEMELPAAPGGSHPSPQPSPLHGSWTPIVALSLLSVIALFGFWSALRSPPEPSPATEPRSQIADQPPPNFAKAPEVTVTRIAANPRTDVGLADTQSLVRELVAALSRFDTITVLDDSAHAGHQAEYRLVGDISTSGENLEISFTLLYGSQGQVAWSRRYPVAGKIMDMQARRPVVQRVASTLARSSGVIFADRFRRMPALDENARGYPCLIDSTRYFEEPSEPLFIRSRSCLERTIAAEPRDAPAHSALALLYVDGFLRHYPSLAQTDVLPRAATVAHEAVTLAPQSAQAHLALFMVRFFDRRFEDAFQSAQRALEFNPYSIEIKARVASAYVLRGEFSKGDRLLGEVAAVVERGPAWLEFFHFLSAYAREDMDSARRYAARVRMTKTPLGLLARIIMEHRDGDTADAQKWIASLRETFPRFAADVPAVLDRIAMAEPLRTRLLSDLAAAGAIPKTVSANP
jgi:TolB-like protein